MAGRIPERDIAAIRDKVRIEDVVGEYVALRRAGSDSMKGLCPFHDEKSPSFHVRKMAAISAALAPVPCLIRSYASAISCMSAYSMPLWTILTKWPAPSVPM